VQHEGIATHELGPDPAAVVKTRSGVVLKAGDPVITYVARNLEPYRGFHIFMRALEQVQKAHPTCQAVIVGGDEVSYGKRPKDASNWREAMLNEVTVDPVRTHFLGRVPREQFIRMLQVSAAHVYLTYPFVLSWSLLEAKACGAAIVASDTEPVREAIRDGVSGWLVDFFQIEKLSQRVLEALDADASLLRVRQQAALDAQSYAQVAAVPSYERLLIPIEQRTVAPAEDSPGLACVRTNDRGATLQRSLAPRSVAC
jgi:glycosyltransferase involved in cell wall biosynthesis